MHCHCESPKDGFGNMLLIGFVVISVLSVLLKELWYEFETWFNGRVNNEVKHAIRDLQRDGDFVLYTQSVKEDAESVRQEPSVRQEASVRQEPSVREETESAKTDIIEV